MEEIMTIEEASEKYCIPIKILKEYESMELCKTVKRVIDRKSTRLNSSHSGQSRMPSSA